MTFSRSKTVVEGCAGVDEIAQDAARADNINADQAEIQQKVNHVRQELSSSDGWVLKSDKNGIIVLYKMIKGPAMEEPKHFPSRPTWLDSEGPALPSSPQPGSTQTRADSPGFAHQSAQPSLYQRGSWGPLTWFADAMSASPAREDNGGDTEIPGHAIPADTCAMCDTSSGILAPNKEGVASGRSNSRSRAQKDNREENDDAGSLGWNWFGGKPLGALFDVYATFTEKGEGNSTSDKAGQNSSHTVQGQRERAVRQNRLRNDATFAAETGDIVANCLCVSESGSTECISTSVALAAPKELPTNSNDRASQVVRSKGDRMPAVHDETHEQPSSHPAPPRTAPDPGPFGGRSGVPDTGDDISRLSERREMQTSEEHAESKNTSVSASRPNSGAEHRMHTCVDGARLEEAWSECGDSGEGHETFKHRAEEEDNSAACACGEEESKQTIFSMRVEGMVDTPMFYLLALLKEIDLFTEWMPQWWGLGVIESQVLKSPSPTKFLARVALGLPPPLFNRDFIIEIDGVDCMSKNDDPKQIVCLLNSVKEFQGEPVPEVREGYMRATLLNSAVVLTPKANGSTFVQILMCVDVRLGLVPQWLIDSSLRHIGHQMLVLMRGASDIVQQEKYMARMSNPQDPFYALIRERIREDLPDEAKYLPPARHESTGVDSQDVLTGVDSQDALTGVDSQDALT